mmetsp:Transcript_56081/g.181923  ORF Transcript_56081/g.181923 Transcript_56081/m.181923 type:complete len:212 (-) Transcript_56081:1530-2165(-)
MVSANERLIDLRKPASRLSCPRTASCGFPSIAIAAAATARSFLPSPPYRELGTTRCSKWVATRSSRRTCRCCGNASPEATLEATALARRANAGLICTLRARQRRRYSVNSAATVSGRAVPTQHSKRSSRASTAASAVGVALSPRLGAASSMTSRRKAEKLAAAWAAWPWKSTTLTWLFPGSCRFSLESTCTVATAPSSGRSTYMAANRGSS